MINQIILVKQKEEKKDRENLSFSLLIKMINSFKRKLLLVSRSKGTFVFILILW